MRKEILVIGSMNVDMTVRLKTLPKVGETVLTQETIYGLGGKGANQACAAARLGGRVRMMGCVGDDDFGKKQLSALKEAGVDVSGIRIAPRVHTGTAIVCVDEGGGNCIIVERGANQQCDETYIQAGKDAISASDYVLVQMEIPQDSLFWAIRHAHEAGKCVVLNPAPAPDMIPDDIYAMVDYLTPNETELLRLTQQLEDDPCGSVCREKMLTGAQQLLEKGVKAVIVTMGSEGCGIYCGGKAEYYDALPVKAVDTTGAGDCFNGAFVAALAEGFSEQEAVRFAVCASAISVTRPGAQSSLPNRLEVESALRSHLHTDPLSIADCPPEGVFTDKRGEVAV